MTDERIMPRRALVSVSDKTGLLELGQALAQAGVEIVSTGSTARTSMVGSRRYTRVFTEESWRTAGTPSTWLRWSSWALRPSTG